MKYIAAMTGNKHSRGEEHGFILLLTVLITSIILAISFSIYAITLKELVLSSYLKNSAQALVAADRGSECALYWDRAPTFTNQLNPDNSVPTPLALHFTLFATSTHYDPNPRNFTATCDTGAGSVILENIWGVPLTGLDSTGKDIGVTEFELTFSDNTCVHVKVEKVDNVDTTITADGYNTACNSTSPRKTQRTIQILYNL